MTIIWPCEVTSISKPWPDCCELYQFPLKYPPIVNGAGVPGVRRPIACALVSVNQRLPSGPPTIAFGPASGVGSMYSLKLPSEPRRPIWFTADSVNQSAPSGPVVIPAGPEFGVGSATVSTCPSAVAKPSRPPLVMNSGPVRYTTVNQSAPSGPRAMRPRIGLMPYTWYSALTWPLVFMTPTCGSAVEQKSTPQPLSSFSVNQILPSPPTPMPPGCPAIGKCETTPSGVMRPMLLLNGSLNQ